MLMPSPGSLEAINKGCNCPIGGNNYGRGAFNVPQEEASLVFIHLRCPVHGIDQMAKQNKLYSFDRNLLNKQ